MKIVINNKQRKELERLWFIYGNGGHKSNFNQHRFIQCILEQDDYDPKFWGKKRYKKSAKLIAPKNNFNDYILSQECIQAVDKILNNELSNTL